MLKGALVAADVTRPLSSLVTFQYNPDSVRRTLNAKTAGDGGDPGEVLRLAGPPDESISLMNRWEIANLLVERTSASTCSPTGSNPAEYRRVDNRPASAPSLSHEQIGRGEQLIARQRQLCRPVRGAHPGRSTGTRRPPRVTEPCSVECR